MYSFPAISKFLTFRCIFYRYGISLCSIDSDQDGVSELIVGAPFYLSLDSKERPEQGLVYVYGKSKTGWCASLRSRVAGKEKTKIRTQEGLLESYGIFRRDFKNFYQKRLPYQVILYF